MSLLWVQVLGPFKVFLACASPACCPKLGGTLYPNGLVLWVARKGMPSLSSPQNSADLFICPQPVTQLPAGLLVEASSLRVYE